MSDRLDRAHGALAGLALGDALGMPTQSFTRAEVLRRYGVVRDLLDGPVDQPIAPGRRAGSITDDTEQTVLLGREMVRGAGRLDPRAWATALADWEHTMADQGSLDLLGPSTSRAIALIRQGVDPADAGSGGTTNGAAMRIAPVGIAVPWGLDGTSRAAFLDAVAAACLPTHHTSLAIAGAAAVGAVVSVGVGGHADHQDGWREAALAAAEGGQTRGRLVPGPSVAARISWVLQDCLRQGSATEQDAWISDVVGATVATQESVPAAFALLPAALDDPWEGLCRAASLGGDTDTVAAMLGAMTGALRGRNGLPTDRCDAVEELNGLDLRSLAQELLDLRDASAPAPVTGEH